MKLKKGILQKAAPTHTCVPPSWDAPDDNHIIADYVSYFCLIINLELLSSSALPHSVGQMRQISLLV